MLLTTLFILRIFRPLSLAFDLPNAAFQRNFVEYNGTKFPTENALLVFYSLINFATNGITTIPVIKNKAPILNIGSLLKSKICTDKIEAMQIEKPRLANILEYLMKPSSVFLNSFKASIISKTINRVNANSIMTLPVNS